MPTTYPVGGYVNMNQLAHMALQHQGLCPSADQKQECEDASRGAPPPHTARRGVDHWEDTNPHAQQPRFPPNSAGIGNITHLISYDMIWCYAMLCYAIFWKTWKCQGILQLSGKCQGKKPCQGKLLQCMHGLGSWHRLWHDNAKTQTLRALQITLIDWLID